MHFIDLKKKPLLNSNSPSATSIIVYFCILFLFKDLPNDTSFFNHGPSNDWKNHLKKLSILALKTTLFWILMIFSRRQKRFDRHSFAIDI